jgi:hypothetical protein
MSVSSQYFVMIGSRTVRYTHHPCVVFVCSRVDLNLHTGLKIEWLNGMRAHPNC